MFYWGATMREQSSYAYIRNPYRNTVEKEGTESVIGRRISPRKCINEVFKKETEEPIEILEKSISKQIFKAKIKLDSEIFEVMVTINNVKHNVYVDIEVDGKTKVKIIKCLEYIHKNLEESDLNKKNDYIQIITYDAISEYYCNKIFRDLAMFERKLRNLMLSIYLIHFEENYYEHQFDEKLKAEIKRSVKTSGGKQKEVKIRIKESFYSVDLGTVKEMLFTPKFTDYEVKKINKMLSKTKDLSALSDSELRYFISSLLPKSDWERFFADKMDERDFKEIFERIKDNRNKVAHQKFFYQEDYSQLKEDLKIFTKAIDKAIEITKDEDFSKQNSEYMKESFEVIKNVSVVLSNALEEIAERMKPLNQMIVNTFANMKVPKLNMAYFINEDDEEPESDDENIE